MHVFPQLRKLEHKYKNELAVIGVHSAKFTSEQNTDNLRKAVLRYELEHPVINDGQFTVWKQYSGRAWPTLIFIDPQGKIIGKHEGEITFEDFDSVIAQMVEEFEGKGILDRTPLDHRPKAPLSATGRPGSADGRMEEGGKSALAFPGKVLADEATDRLFISDSNHNRIIISTLDGEVRQVIGSGEAGFDNGDFRTASFDHPQGMALDGDVLYVADTENHAIRRVDLAGGKVETVAGTGRQARGFGKGGEASSTDLSSPWDLALHDGTLYIAMAGNHQLWSLDLEAKRVRPYAGNGREAPVDGPLLSASLDQPSGITTDGKVLYFADSEASAIRTADLSDSGRVGTIVGQDLFVFGDVDGTGDAVRLQHPIGIHYHDGVLYVADTYNNKIKRVFPQTRSVLTMLGTGEPGYLDDEANQALFHEPGDVSVAAGKLYVADTNNHAIRVAGLDTGEVGTLELRGV